MEMIRIGGAIFVLCLGAGSLPAAAACNPLETRSPNAADQRPAQGQQTHACAEQSNVAFDAAGAPQYAPQCPKKYILTWDKLSPGSAVSA